MQLFSVLPLLLMSLLLSIASLSAADVEGGLQYLKDAVHDGDYRGLSPAETLKFPFPSLKSHGPRGKTCAECMWVLRELLLRVWPGNVHPTQVFLKLDGDYLNRHYLTWYYDHKTASGVLVKSDYSLNTQQLALSCSKLLDSVDIGCAPDDFEKERTLQSFPEELHDLLRPIAEPRGRPRVLTSPAEIQAETKLARLRARQGRGYLPSHHGPTATLDHEERPDEETKITEGGLEYLKRAVRMGDFKALSPAETLKFPFPTLKTQGPGRSYHWCPVRGGSCAECMWVLRELTWLYYYLPDQQMQGVPVFTSDLLLNTQTLSFRCPELLKPLGIDCMATDFEKERTLKSFPTAVRRELAPIANPRGPIIVHRTPEEAFAEEQLALDRRNPHWHRFQQAPPPARPVAQHATTADQTVRGWIHSIEHSAQNTFRRLRHLPVPEVRPLRTPVQLQEVWIPMHE
ncbi:MAG: hypothetical protein M1826_003937 [Phylliscum demangeonii]|nr:MAG: hypothetical protein M1826_003937 [Phylliscum demangeonii]